MNTLYLDTVIKAIWPPNQTQQIRSRERDKNVGVYGRIQFYSLKIYINEFMCSSKTNILEWYSHCRVDIFNTSLLFTYFYLLL
jgi:hypothetical protein